MSVAKFTGAIVGGIGRARRCRPAQRETNAARLRRGASLRLCNESSREFGRGPPACTLVLRDPTQLRSLVTWHGTDFLADAYFRCQIDVEGVLCSVGPELGAYPIPGRLSPENAIHDYGRARDEVVAKQHIVAEAKALGSA